MDVVKTLSACKQLTHLSVSGNTLGDGGHQLAHSITAWAPNAPLQQLSLKDCKMTQDASVDVVKTLSACKQLTHLSLSGNTLGDGGHQLAHSITAWAPNAPLQQLLLKDCKMPQVASVDVVKSLSACRQLTHLSLSGNTLGDGGHQLAYSITAWAPNAPLQQLWLEDCKMPQDASVDVVKTLSACKQLTRLILSGNTLGDGGHQLAHSITAWAPNAPLQQLSLKDCKMPQDASVHVIKSLSACKQLTHLILLGNTLGDGGRHLAHSSMGT